MQEKLQLAKDLAKQTAKTATDSAAAAVDNVKTVAENTVSRIDGLVDDLEESASKALGNLLMQLLLASGTRVGLFDVTDLPDLDGRYRPICSCS